MQLRNCFQKLVKMDTFRLCITISSISSKVFRTMFLKTHTVGIIPRTECRMGDRQSVEVLQWWAYIGWTTNNITHAGNGREVHLLGVHNVKDDDFCAEIREIFEYLRCFWHGCQCMSNRQ